MELLLKHIKLGLTFGISMSVISWVVGIILGSVLAKTVYFDRLSQLNFITRETWNRRIGLHYCKWIIKNTPLKFLNQNIKVKSKNIDLREVRREMTQAEINHLIGFLLVAIVALLYAIRVSFVFGISMMLPNVFLNLYPSLLQQLNKRRIDRLIS